MKTLPRKLLKREIGDQAWSGCGDVAIPLIWDNDRYEFVLDHRGKLDTWVPVDPAYQTYFRRLGELLQEAASE